MTKKETLEKKLFFADTDFFVGLQGKIMALQDKIGRKEIINKVCRLVDSLKKYGHLCKPRFFFKIIISFEKDKQKCC